MTAGGLGTTDTLLPITSRHVRCRLSVSSRRPEEGVKATAERVRCQMRLFPGVVWIAVIASLLTISGACGGGGSEDDADRTQEELLASQVQIQSLEERIQKLQTAETVDILASIGTLMSINALMLYPPTVVDIKPNSASIQMVTKEPTTCSIAWGLTEDYGAISTDDNMAPGGHADHFHVLHDLQPDTVYYYKWGLFGRHGSLYGSEGSTFRTPPEASGGSGQ